MDKSKLKTYLSSERKSKVNSSLMANTYITGSSMRNFINMLPKTLKVNDIVSLARSVVNARNNGKPVIAMIGGHVIKTGCSPLLTQLIADGFITHIASNGAAAIHDTEMAMNGQTSEDVESQICDGSFGMAEDTALVLNTAAKVAAYNDTGFGEALGDIINKEQYPLALQYPYKEISLVQQCYSLDVPYTIHVAIGTDIVHQHMSVDPAAIGQATYNDFIKFASVICMIGDGGVVINFGSAVIMPEVFLKSLSMARNITGSVTNFTTANFDMLQHYRPRVNVVQRPVMGGGNGYSITGHHEIMIPLLTAMIYEENLKMN